MDTIKLNNHQRIPQLGFGVFQISNEKDCEKSVLTALQTGYRMIDTAACYGNEAAVGSALRKSQIDRRDVFLVSKVWIQDSGYERTMKSFEKTLKNLQTDYLDMYLIHMPYGDYHGSWRAMEDLYKAGKVKSIGVCNFLADRLVDLVLSHEILPAVNQIELHPVCQQKKLRDVMDEFDIKPMAWAPFAEGRENMFHNAKLVEIGSLYHKSVAQVILRWMKQQQIITIPKSVHTNRIIENFAINDFRLSDKDVKIIKDMDQNKPFILDVQDLKEIHRLHNIHFKQ